jgi:hypothetical protein
MFRGEVPKLMFVSLSAQNTVPHTVAVYVCKEELFKLLFKGIVSRDWGGLLMVSLDR